MVPVQGFTQEITGVLLGWSSFLVSEPCLGQGGQQHRCEGKFGVKGVTEVGRGLCSSSTSRVYRSYWTIAVGVLHIKT